MKKFPIAIQIRAKNGVIQKFLDEMGWSQVKLGKVIGASQSAINAWVCLKDYPKKQELIDKLCELLGENYEDIFPEFIKVPEFLTLKKSHTFYQEIDKASIEHWNNSKYLSNDLEDGVFKLEMRDKINKSLAYLTRIEENIVRTYHGLGTKEMNLREIGKELGLSPERVRQIKEKALRKLRRRTNLHVFHPEHDIEEEIKSNLESIHLKKGALIMSLKKKL